MTGCSVQKGARRCGKTVYVVVRLVLGDRVRTEMCEPCAIRHDKVGALAWAIRVFP